MVLKNDIATFSVHYLNREGKIQSEKFTSFAGAAGCADALSGVTRFLDVCFSSPDGSGSISGSLYCYSKVDNSRRRCNEYLINQVLLREVA